MYRILLVDDEPLILAGIASMMKWEDYNCTVVGRRQTETRHWKR